MAEEIRTVGVLGCGLMGSGIVEVCAKSGYNTIVLEEDADALKGGVSRVQKSLGRAVERKRLGTEEALQIGIVCERRSHRFFQRYGSQFEESEGKRIFLEFAREERDHLNILMRELRKLRARRSGAPTRRAGASARG